MKVVCIYIAVYIGIVLAFEQANKKVDFVGDCFTDLHCPNGKHCIAGKCVPGPREVTTTGTIETTTETPAPKENIVQVSIYFETKCNDSIKFYQTQFLPTFHKLQPTGRVNFTLVPFGRAFFEAFDNDGKEDFRFGCQHGPDECRSNIIWNCVLNKIKIEEAISGINCILRPDNSHKGMFDAVFDPDPYFHCFGSYRSCVDSEEGRRLLAKAGNATAALSPPLTSVPWIVIDDEHIDDAVTFLLGSICTRLHPRPQECYS